MGILDAPSYTRAQAAATFAARQTPPTTAAATGIYARHLNLYNAKPAHLFALRAALGRLRAGTGDCNLGFLGDSTVAGTNTDAPLNTSIKAWPVIVRNLLVARGYPSAGTGWVPAYNGSSTAEPRWVLGSGWSATTTDRISVSNWGANSNTLTFTSDTAGTTARLYYSNAGGPFTWSVDGGAAVAVTPANTQSIGYVENTTLANTTHTITVVRTSGLPEILGAEVRTAAYGVRIFNGGIAGLKSSALASAGPLNVNASVVGSSSAPFKAHAVFVCAGINDQTGGGGAVVPVDSYKASMTTALTAAKAQGASVMIVAPAPLSTAGMGPYIGAMYELADSLDLPLLDLSDRWGSYTTANTASLMAGTVHPSYAGNADIATAVLNAVGAAV